MWPRSWNKLLALLPATAVFLTACPDSHKRKDPANSYSYAGVWVNADLYGAYRDLYKADRAQFCRVLIADPGRFGIEQEPYGNQLVVVDSWVINNRGEVLVYNPRYRPQDTGYRETYWKGSVDQNGYFRRRTGTGFQSVPANYGQFQNSQYYFYYASDARLFMNSTNSMKVWAGNSSREYVRTEDRPGNQEMANIYMAAVACFSTGVNEKPHYPDIGGENPQGVYPPRGGSGGVIVERRGGRRRVIVPAPAPCPGGPNCAVVGGLPGGATMGPPPPPMNGQPPAEIPPPEEEIPK